MNNSKQFPTKTKINLVIKERKAINVLTFIPMLLLILILSGLFGKFAVADQITLASDAQRRAEEAESALEELKSKTVTYDDVLAEYNKYASDGGAPDEEQNYADRMDVLALIDKSLMNKTDIESYSLAANTLSVKLLSVDLNDVSDLLNELYSLPIVDGVVVSSAGTIKSDTKTAVAMTITLQKLQETGGDDDEA